MNLPRKFLQMHTDAMCRAYLEHGPIVRVAPVEPLGAPSDGVMDDATITLVTVRGINEGGVVRFEAASPADQAAAEAWAKKHEHTTREEFEWLPSFAAGGGIK